MGNFFSKLATPLSLACAAISVGCSLGSGQSIDLSSDQSSRDFLPGFQIIYSGNLNGDIEPCGCRATPTGGINRRLNLLAQKASGEKLSLDSGDVFYQSSPVPGFLESQWNYQAGVLVKAYNSFQIDAMTPGELDFAAGLDQFKALIKSARFKLISANLYEKKTGQRLLDSFVIVKRGGKRVAVFGITDETLLLPEEVLAKDSLRMAKQMVSELRGKADVLIALTHEGIEKDEELARKVPGIDAIFGAHSHSFLLTPEKIGDTLIFQSSSRGQHVGIYSGGQNQMIQVDARFDSPPEKPNELDKLLIEAKKEIAKLNLQAEIDLSKDSAPAENMRAFQTFPRCAQCHVAQYEFHKNTPHFKAFETLVKAHQSANLDCLKCHTVGSQYQTGWTRVSQLVQNIKGKPIDAESFSGSLPKMARNDLGKISKAFINVQCENCHTAGGEHPSSGSYPKEVSETTCLQCHTAERAPLWYKEGKPDMDLVRLKLKSMACPRN